MVVKPGGRHITFGPSSIKMISLGVLRIRIWIRIRWIRMFWLSWIRIRIHNLFVQIRIRILPSTSLKRKKNLDFYCFVTSL